jgi:hypothetical protein
MPRVFARAEAMGVTIPALTSASGDPNCLRSACVSDTAYRALHRWVTTGEAPTSAPRIELSRDPGKPIALWRPFDDSVIARDEHGNAKGGIRLPDIEVPLARWDGATNGNRLGGAYGPFDLAKVRSPLPVARRLRREGSGGRRTARHSRLHRLGGGSQVHQRGQGQRGARRTARLARKPGQPFDVIDALVSRSPSPRLAIAAAERNASRRRGLREAAGQRFVITVRWSRRLCSVPACRTVRWAQRYLSSWLCRSVECTFLA